VKKRLISFILFIIILAVSFAAPFSGGEEIIENFLNEGKYVKFYKNANDVFYVSIQTIASVMVDGDEIEFHLNDKDAFNADEDEISFNIKRYTFSLDENKNLIIKKK